MFERLKKFAANFQELIDNLFEEELQEGKLSDLIDTNKLSTDADVQKLPPDIIRLDSAKMCKTTGWYNNCGLNTLTHFIKAKLQNREIQEQFAADPDYQALLIAFQTYYQLPYCPTWDDIDLLFKRFPVPTDAEALFAPVLRYHLGELLAKEDPNLSWDTDGSAAFSVYIRDGAVTDMANPIFHANKEKMKELRAQYQQAFANLYKGRGKYTLQEKALAKRQFREKKPPILQPTKKQLFAQMRFQRKNDLLDQFLDQAKAYWLEAGHQRYAALMGNLENATMVSAPQLVLIAQKLKIGLEIYTPASIIDFANKKLQQPTADFPSRGELPDETGGMEYLPEPGHTWLFRVYNRSNHWIFEDIAADPQQARRNAQQHNKHYPDTFDASYHADSSLSGVFKIRGSDEPNLVQRIKQTILSLFVQKMYQTYLQDPDYVAAEETLNTLVDNLDQWSTQQQITPEQQAQIFENYFTQFQQALTQENKKSAVDSLQKEVIENKIETLKSASL